MSIYKIEFLFSGVWTEYTNEINSRDIEKTEVLYSNLQNADASMKITIQPDLTLFNLFRGAGNDNIAVRVNKNSIPYFFGYIRKTFSFSKAQKLKPVVLEIVSQSFLLKRKFTSPIFSVDVPASTLIGLLLVTAGVTNYTLPSIASRLPVFSALPTDSTTFYEYINGILYEYGYCFKFDETGKFVTFKILPDSIVPVKQFDITNCISEIVQEKKEETYEKIIVEWTGTQELNGVPIFSDTTGAANGNKCNINVDPLAFFGGAEEWYPKPTRPEGDILFYQGPSLVMYTDPWVQQLKFVDNLQTILVSIKNTSGFLTGVIRRFDIYANRCVIKKDVNRSIVTKNSTTEKIETVTTKYIFNKTDADALANELAWYYNFSDYTYSLSSKEDIATGSAVIISATGIGTITARIIAKKTNEFSGVFSYTAEGISEYIPDVITAEYLKDNPVPVNEQITSALDAISSGIPATYPDDITSVSVIARQDYLDISWPWSGVGLKNNLKRFQVEVSNDGITWATLYSTKNSYAYYFDRLADGYPEKTTGVNPLSGWRVRVKAENIYSQQSLGYGPSSAGQVPDVSQYLTWIPPAPTVSALATETGLDVTVTLDDSSYYGSNKTLSILIGGTLRQSGIQSKIFSFPWNRSIDGYPEKVVNGGTLDTLNIQIKAVTAENTTGTTSVAVHPDVSQYLTWIPAVPLISVAASGRNISLALKQGNICYGFYGFRIEIRKDGEVSWYATGDSTQAWIDETAYKTGVANGYTETPLTNFSQVVPLTNQSIDMPEDTLYYYRLAAVTLTNVQNASAYCTDTLTIAKGTSQKDVIAGAIKNAQLGAGAVTNDKITAKTIIAENLSVVALNKINSFAVEADGTTGWTLDTGASIEIVSGYRTLKLLTTGGWGVGAMVETQSFSVLPDEVIEFSFGLSCPNYVNNSGLYIGLKATDAYSKYTYDFTQKKWVWVSTVISQYFVQNYTSVTRKNFKTYILGSNVDILSIPAPAYTDTTYPISCLKLQAGNSITTIRTAYNITTAGTYWYLFLPQCYTVGGSKIVAQQIDVKDLSAINASLGKVTGSDAINQRIVLSPGYEGESYTDPVSGESFDIGKEGTIISGATTDDAYIRKMYSTTVNKWRLFFKAWSFIVTSVSSKILGLFQVRNATDTASVFEADPVSGTVTVTGELYATGFNGLVRVKNDISFGNNGLQMIQSNVNISNNPDADWWSSIIMNHPNSLGYLTQIASCFIKDQVFFRRLVTGVYSSWRRFVFYDDMATFTTPDQGDNSTRAATTAWVKQNGLTTSGINSFTASGTITAAMCGSLIYYNSGYSGTLTLPTPGLLPFGSVIAITNVGNGICTIAGANIYVYGGVFSSVPIKNGESLMLVANGGNWMQLVGHRQTNFSISADLTTGYEQSERGRLIQWGSVYCTQDSSVTQTFLIAFPNACISCSVTPKVSSSVVDNWGMVVGFTTTTITLARGMNAGTSESGDMFWIAIGY